MHEQQKKQRHLRLHSVAEAFTRPIPVIDYIVDGLLTRSGLSIIAADPKSGKSVFTRQMIVALADGIHFLGRECKESKSILLQVEGDPYTPLRHFKKLGLKNSRNIMTLSERIFAASSHEALSLLEEVLVEHKPNVIVIDTLSKFLTVEDSGNNDEVNTVCGAFEEMARKHRVHIVGVMHTKKRKDGGLAQAVMGATAWRGAGESVITLEKKSDRRRTFQAELRDGPEIEETYLEFDAEREYLTAGTTLEFEQEHLQAVKVQTTEQKIATAMLNFLTGRPMGASRNEWLACCEGRNQTKVNVIAQLVASGQVSELGAGIKGAPKTYMFNVFLDTQKGDS